MYLSQNGTRAWLEVSEPILKSYVSWRIGKHAVQRAYSTPNEQRTTAQVEETVTHALKRIKTSGLNAFASNKNTSRRKHEDRKNSHKCENVDSCTSNNSRPRATKLSYFHNPYTHMD
jgi:hypothetical protein